MQNSFDPREVETWMRLVDKACAELGGCDDATRNLIAARVISCASRGQSDPTIVLSFALNGLRNENHAM